MNCLENHIGIRNCNSPEPTSGLYVNQLPGITLESIQKVSDSENINFMGAWKEVKVRSWSRLENDLRIALKKRYKLKSVNANAKISSVIDEATIISAAEYYRGVVIDLGSEVSFLSIGINSFSLKLPNTVSSLNIKVFDQDGNMLESITRENAPAGKNIFPIGRNFLTSILFIGVDATMVPLYSSSVSSDTHASCCKCVQTICDNCQPAIYGTESPIAGFNIGTEGSNLFGFEVDYSVVCDYSSIICRNKPEFTYPWLYLLGAELMQERLFSTRLNRFTTIDKEAAADLRDYFTEEYQSALEESIQGIEVSEVDCCIICNPIIYRRAILP